MGLWCSVQVGGRDERILSPRYIDIGPVILSACRVALVMTRSHDSKVDFRPILRFPGFFLLSVFFVAGCGGEPSDVLPSSNERSPSETNAEEAVPLRRIIEVAKLSVFTVLARDSSGDVISKGTGFSVESNGILLTNAHVVEGAEEVSVRASNGGVFEVEGIAAIDTEHDLVALKIRAKDLPVLRIATEGSLEVGDSVVTVGSPFGLENTVTEGIVSGFRELDDESVNLSGTIIQFSAPVSSGSSGSPMFDRHGDVVGIVSAKISRGEGLGFAVPISDLNYLLNRIGETELMDIGQSGGGSRFSYKIPKAILENAHYQDYLEARDEFQELHTMDAAKKLVEQFPNSSLAHEMLGFSYLLNFQKASVNPLAKAIELAPENHRARCTYTEALSMFGEKSEYLDSMDSAITENPLNFSALLAKSSYFRMSYEPNAASQSWRYARLALEIMPALPDVHISEIRAKISASSASSKSSNVILESWKDTLDIFTIYHDARRDLLANGNLDLSLRKLDEFDGDKAAARLVMHILLRQALELDLRIAPMHHVAIQELNNSLLEELRDTPIWTTWSSHWYHEVPCKDWVKNEFHYQTGSACLGFEGTTLALLRSGSFPLYQTVKGQQFPYETVFEPVSSVSESELAEFCELTLVHRELLEGIFEIEASMGLFSKRKTDDVASSIKKFQLCISYGVSERSLEVLGDLINRRSPDEWGQPHRRLFGEAVRLASKDSRVDWEEQINSTSDKVWKIKCEKLGLSKESVAKAVRRVVKAEALDDVVVKAEVLDGVQDSDNRVAAVKSFIREHNSSSNRDSVSDELGYYADEVEYFDNGKVDREFVLRDLVEYRAKWNKKRQYVIEDPISVKRTSYENYEANCVIRFSVERANESVSGRVRNTYKIRFVEGVPEVRSITSIRLGSVGG